MTTLSKYDLITFFVFKDERSDKRNQILQKALAHWLGSEGNSDAAFMVRNGKKKIFMNGVMLSMFTGIHLLFMGSHKSALVKLS